MGHLQTVSYHNHSHMHRHKTTGRRNRLAIPLLHLHCHLQLWVPLRRRLGLKYMANRHYLCGLLSGSRVIGMFQWAYS